MPVPSRSVFSDDRDLAGSPVRSGVGLGGWVCCTVRKDPRIDPLRYLRGLAGSPVRPGGGSRALIGAHG